jgi:tRNA threonylcarbamoyladenosine biosynthesis protein TsaE
MSADPEKVTVQEPTPDCFQDLTPDCEEAMIALGGRLAGALVPGMIVYLNGDLGMGKTTLARGFIQSLGHKGAVKSPTYTLVEPYEFPELTVYHFDLYRLADPEELEFMGVRDYFDKRSVCLIEWARRGAGFLPPADLVINIEREGLGRAVQLQAFSALGEGVINAMGRE